MEVVVPKVRLSTTKNDVLIVMKAISSIVVALRSINGLALCTGLGGLEIGIKIAEPQYRTVVHVERNSYAASIIVERMEQQTLDQAALWDEISTFDGTPWRGIVDVVSVGMPCQPFSSAGKQHGKTDERYLWPEVKRIIKETEPEWVFLENVRAHIDIGLEEVRSDLLRLGFDVEGGIFSAEEVGAPHQRERVFVLAHAPSAGQLRTEQQENRTASRARKNSDDSHKKSSDMVNVERKQTFWPPGPNGKWDDIDPSLEPALRGDASGFSRRLVRMEQLHALGNACMPLVAAHAWRTLKTRFET